MRYKHRNPPYSASAFVTLILLSLECAPFFLSFLPQIFTEHPTLSQALAWGERKEQGALSLHSGAHGPAEETWGGGMCDEVQSQPLLLDVTWGLQEHLPTQFGVGGGFLEEEKAFDRCWQISRSRPPRAREEGSIAGAGGGTSL